MQFLYPIAFFAIIGIIVPIMIHLWNVKQGKTLKIGSIIFLGESSSKSSRSFKITDWLLLLLRCLLILIIAFLLAEPFINDKLVANGDKGWVLIEKEQIKNLSKTNLKEIDSLTQSGFEIHDLNINFPALNLKDTASWQETNTTKLSSSSLLKQLNTQLPAGFKVYWYGANLLNQYPDEVLKSSLAIQFRNILKTDSTVFKVAEAYFTNKDSLKVLLINSTSGQTNYSFQNVNDQTKNVLLKIDSGLSFLKTKEQSSWIKADTNTVYVSVYEAQNQKDASYLKAAILAIRDYSGRKISVQVVKNPKEISPQTNILFWLSTAAIPQNLKEEIILFSYEDGKEEVLNSTIQTKVNLVKNESTFALYKRILYKDENANAIWTDGFGKSILSYQYANQLHHYRFYSRFNPQWTDLVWSEEFVKALMPLVLVTPLAQNQFGFELDSADQRAATQPFFYSQNNLKKKAERAVAQQNPISNWVWILAFLVFALERILSFKQKKA
ncbi:BatA domain-containing protein [Pedobacter cryophilus]|uniref:Aerotolerance regulator N-terminal domain-containing protein n=1 Tax=Pedobacter cryophilus TaxID=2571271 RepID=A0A4U1BX42_9SPHI|nr:BatA domain-containing protein [Pedobacter cryophilus]TKB96924.1 hypothetical protein FA046_12680 [Pedobacter cryophilus]